MVVDSKKNIVVGDDGSPVVCPGTNRFTHESNRLSWYKQFYSRIQSFVLVQTVLLTNQIVCPGTNHFTHELLM